VLIEFDLLRRCGGCHVRDHDSETDPAEPLSPGARGEGTLHTSEVQTPNPEMQDLLEKCEDALPETQGINDPELLGAIRDQIHDRKAPHTYSTLALEPEPEDDVPTQGSLPAGSGEATDPLQPATPRDPSEEDSKPCDRSHIGRYRVIRLLGQGGLGRVYLGHDAELVRFVAIKVPITERLAQLVNLDSYLNEARIVARLSHPNIVPVYDVGRTDDGQFFVVSRYMEGGDLAARMKRGRSSLVEVAELVATVAEALHYAHTQDLFHRDVKPANILLDADGLPSVADFGLALKDENVGMGGQLMGTAAYMSPEQARGEGHLVDGRSDIFSLGIVFYELLTGRRPFRGSSRPEVMHKIINHEPRPPRQIDDQIPRELERICMKALWKRASDRYLSAADLVEDLRHFVDTAAAAGNPEVISRAPINLGGGSSAGPKTATASAPCDLSGPAIKIVPKGLSSFDEHDADFFLELLPGPRDRAGLPDGLRFWKTRIEAIDPDRTFRVGIIYGPSGCGKSSLVKAGLLPLLREHIESVYLEASGDGTEARLLRLIHKACPGLAGGGGLVESFAALRRGRHLPSGSKMLVVLDQFEQWLFARSHERAAELVAALRQCDGEHVQVLCLVRDDFWMATTRFMSDLEIDLVPDRNVAAVDLFDPKHARKVLTAYGRAYETLPARDHDLTREQGSFLDQAVSGLAHQGKVVPVRLALFAEMVKGKPWTPATLREVGGMDGVGVRFLDETFSSTRSSPKHRYHEKAAQAVLKSLLPETDADIKGRMRSVAALRTLSGYSERSGDFDELIRILDTQLRLITPVDPEGSIDGDVPGGSTVGRAYQLTHDYLVHSLRAWLTRKQRATRQGRAELLLAERAALWLVKPEARHLPSAREWLQVRSFTRRKDWTDSQRQMMARAGRRHGVRLLGLSAALAALIGAGTTLIIKTRTRGLLDSILSANVEKIPDILSQLGQYPRWTYSRELRELAERTGTDSRGQLGYSLALLPEDRRQLDFLRQRLLVAGPAETNVLRNAMKPYRAELTPWLWTRLDRAAPDDVVILPVASTLAQYDPADSKWNHVGGKVAGAMVKSKLDDQKSWRDALRNVHHRLLEPLAGIYREKARSEGERLIAVTVLADYAEDQPKFLLDLLLDADPKSFSVLFPVVAKHGPDYVDDLRAMVSLSDNPLTRQAASPSDGTLTDLARLQATELAKESLAARRSRAAVALIRLGHAEEVWPLLAHSEDPRSRGEMITALSRLGAEATAIIDELVRNVEQAQAKRAKTELSPKKNGYLFDAETSKRRALIMALAEYPKQELVSASREEVLKTLIRLHQDDPDAGVHLAAELVLHRWGEPARLTREPAALATAELGARRWYVNPVGQTMVLIDAPVEFNMGSPATDADRDKVEGLHRQLVSQPFAIAAREVTNRDFEKYVNENSEAKSNSSGKFSPDPDGPQVFVNWFEAAAYCNWLSSKEGRPRCYQPNGKGKYAEGMCVDFRGVAAGGYRLPTEVEWEYACRAGALTTRYYGSSAELLTHYEWGLDNSGGHAHACGSRLPNDLGLFDMLGNVFEWCHDRFDVNSSEAANREAFVAEPTISNDSRVMRGASFLIWPVRFRSAVRNWLLAADGSGDIGFRPVRSLP
jgi:eukaryotic-like serine/threonine-protein kinase